MLCNLICFDSTFTKRIRCVIFYKFSAHQDTFYRRYFLEDLLFFFFSKTSRFCSSFPGTPNLDLYCLQVGDRQEVGAIVEVFCKGRKAPLRIGALKSNMGHGEPASALSAVIKVLVAMDCKLLPPNLHYYIPNPDIPALVDGRLSVSTYACVPMTVYRIRSIRKNETGISANC